MNKKIRWITETALLLAMLIVLQSVTKSFGQIVTGSCVNAVLAIAALVAGTSSGIVIAVVSPVLAFLLNIAPQAVTVPAIMVGNTVFVVQQQAERFLGIALVLEPVEGQVGGDVGGVAGDDAALAVIYKGGVVVLALSDEDVPVVEAGGVGGQVPLADDSGFVAGLAQELWEGLLAAVEGAGVVGESVLVAVLAGEQAGPAGTADGVGHEALREDHARIRQPVDVRGLDQAVPVGADGLIRVVVAHDIDDVERFAGFLPVCFRGILSASGTYRAGYGHGQDGLYGPFISAHCLFIISCYCLPVSR